MSKHKDVFRCESCSIKCTVRSWPIQVKDDIIHIEPAGCIHGDWTAGKVRPRWEWVGKNSKE